MLRHEASRKAGFASTGANDFRLKDLVAGGRDILVRYVVDRGVDQPDRRFLLALTVDDEINLGPAGQPIHIDPQILRINLNAIDLLIQLIDDVLKVLVGTLQVLIQLVDDVLKVLVGALQGLIQRRLRLF